MSTHNFKKCLISGCLIIFLFCCNFVFSQSLSLQSPTETIIPNTITIVAEGSAEAKPDIAKFEFDIATTSSKIGKSKKYNAEKTQKVIDVLNKFGIEKKDIKTVSFRINPYGEYLTTHRLKVILRNIEKIDDILEEILKLGITNLSEMKYEIENLDELKNKAYEKTIQVANERVKTLASASGLKIGKIIAIKEFPAVSQLSSVQPSYRIPIQLQSQQEIQPQISGELATTMVRGKETVSTPTLNLFQPGTYEIKVNIIVVYEIEK